MALGRLCRCISLRHGAPKQKEINIPYSPAGSWAGPGWNFIPPAWLHPPAPTNPMTPTSLQAGREKGFDYLVDTVLATGPLGIVPASCTAAHVKGFMVKVRREEGITPQPNTREGPLQHRLGENPRPAPAPLPRPPSPPHASLPVPHQSPGLRLAEGPAQGQRHQWKVVS